MTHSMSHCFRIIPDRISNARNFFFWIIPIKRNKAQTLMSKGMSESIVSRVGLVSWECGNWLPTSFEVLSEKDYSF